MRLIKKMRKQDAVYWHPIGQNQFGEYDYDLPVQIKCRWEDEVVTSIDVSGREVIFYYTIYVDRDVAQDGMLLLGKLEDLTVPLPPHSTAKKVRRFEKLPDLRVKDYLRTAFL